MAEIKHTTDSEIEIMREDVGDFVSNSYESEKDLEKEIEKNINSFCENVLEDKYISHTRQRVLIGRAGGHKRKYKGTLTADIFINCENHNYIIEIKVPRYLSENRSAVGQLLNYGLHSAENTKLVLVTTKIDIDTARVIEFYKLPIIYVFLDKGRFAIHKKGKIDE